MDEDIKKAKTIELRVRCRATRDIGRFYRAARCNMSIQVPGTLDGAPHIVCVHGTQSFLMTIGIGDLKYFLQAAGVPGEWQVNEIDATEGTRLNMIILLIHLVDRRPWKNAEPDRILLPPVLEEGTRPVGLVVPDAFKHLEMGTLATAVTDYNRVIRGHGPRCMVRKGTPGLNPKTGVMTIYAGPSPMDLEVQHVIPEDPMDDLAAFLGAAEL